MKAKATFNIDGSFKITGRGLVIYGDIVDGVIKRENFISFNDGVKTAKLKIASVGFIDKIGSDNISKVGLTFVYADENQKKDIEALKVAKQIAIITEQ